MDAEGYVSVLEAGLKPFIEGSKDPVKFMQDNDPKHTSRRAKAWLEEEEINCWKTPAESPDLNPIENLWHELKELLRREVNPRTKDQLVDGIKVFGRP